MERGLPPFCRLVMKLMSCIPELSHSMLMASLNAIFSIDKISWCDLACAFTFCSVSILRGAANARLRLGRLWDALLQTLLLITWLSAWDNLADGDSSCMHCLG